MPKINIGYRRLYDAISCHLEGITKLRLSFPYSKNINIDVNIGPDPRFGISVVDSDKYIWPGKKTLIANVHYSKDVKKTKYPRNFFCEIYSWKEININDSHYAEFRKGSTEGKSYVLSFVEKEERIFKKAIDLIAGSIGVFYSNQFIKELINEDKITFDKDDYYAISSFSPYVEILSKMTLNSKGIEGIKSFLSRVASVNDKAKKVGTIAFRWVNKAWEERKTVDSFIAFFIAFEVLLLSLDIQPRASDFENFDEILQLVDSQTEGKKKIKLTTFLNWLKSRYNLSLVERFETLAKQAGLQDWKNDVKAFKEFNHMRNRLYHGGFDEVRMAVKISENHVVKLEDIILKYLKYWILNELKNKNKAVETLK